MHKIINFFSKNHRKKRLFATMKTTITAIKYAKATQPE